MKAVCAVVLAVFLMGCKTTGDSSRFGPSELVAFSESEIRTRSWKMGDESLWFAELKTYDFKPGRKIAIATYRTSEGHVLSLDIYLRADWAHGEKGYYLICHDRRRGQIAEVTVKPDKDGLAVEIHRKLRYAIAGKPPMDGTNTYAYYVDEVGRVTESLHDFYSANEAGAK